VEKGEVRVDLMHSFQRLNVTRCIFLGALRRVHNYGGQILVWL
jgi:hypothetical protein